jgi:hypothetical protein
VNRARARSPVSPLPAGIELSGGVLRGCPGGRGRFVRTIDIGSLSTMTLPRSKMTGSTSLLIRIALSKFLGSSSNRVLEFLVENPSEPGTPTRFASRRFGRPTEESRFVAYHDPKPGERESPRTASRPAGVPGAGWADQSTPTAAPRVSPIARFSTRSAIGSRPVGSRLTMTKVAPLRLASSGKPAAG